MPQFQLRYGAPANLDPESLIATDALDAIAQARRRLAVQGVSEGILSQDGVVLQTFGASSSLPDAAGVDREQLFAAAGVYVFANPSSGHSHE